MQQYQISNTRLSDSSDKESCGCKTLRLPFGEFFFGFFEKKAGKDFFFGGSVVIWRPIKDLDEAKPNGNAKSNKQLGENEN